MTPTELRWHLRTRHDAPNYMFTGSDKMRQTAHWYAHQVGQDFLTHTHDEDEFKVQEES